MDFYLGMISQLATATKYATKTNKVKSLEICNIAFQTLKHYNMEEVLLMKTNDVEPLHVNPGITLEDKTCFLYNICKERLITNNDPRLLELNDLLRNLTADEENELREVVTMTITKPGEILYDLI